MVLLVCLADHHTLCYLVAQNIFKGLFEAQCDSLLLQKGVGGHCLCLWLDQDSVVPINKGTSPVCVDVGVYLYLRCVTPKTRKLAQVKNHLVIISGGMPSCLSKKTRKTAERSASFNLFVKERLTST